MSIVLILIVVSLILLGAAAGRPLGWVAIGLAVLALLLALFNGPIRIGSTPQLDKDFGLS